MDFTGDMSKPPASPNEGDMTFESVRYDEQGGEFIARIVMPQSICPTGGANQVESIKVQWRFGNDIRLLKPSGVIPAHMSVQKVSTSSRCPNAAIGRSEFIPTWSYGGAFNPLPNPTSYWWYFSNPKPVPGRRMNFYVSDDPTTISGDIELTLAEFKPGATDARKGYFGMIISTSGCCGTRGRHGVFYSYQYTP